PLPVPRSVPADRGDGGRERRPSNAEREGVLTVHPRGFGFVASLGPGNQGDDVFIPPDALGGALHGDKVRVRVRARSARGAEGEIVSIIERGIKRVAGTLHRKGRSAWLEPDDTRVRGPIVLPRAIDVEGSGGNSGNDGDAVVVAITRWPETRDENPEGRIEQVLGRPGELSVEAAKILVLEGVGEPHSDLAVAEAEAFGEEVPDAMKAGRTDLRPLPLPTIDPEDARDHDDAVWVERIERGGYRAWIAIADVSTYVTPRTAIDDEAKARGCSIYLPTAPSPCCRAPCRRTCARSCPGSIACASASRPSSTPGGTSSRAASSAGSCDRARSSRTAASPGPSGSRPKRASSPPPRRWSRACGSRTTSPARSACSA